MPHPTGWDIPPPEHHQEFEVLCLDLLRALKRPIAEPNLYGRSGQEQHGVDFALQLDDGLHGYQCKRVASFSAREFKAEVGKIGKFPAPLRSYTVLVTTNNDAHVLDAVHEMSLVRVAQAECPVAIVFWPTIRDWLVDQRAVLRKHYPELAPEQMPNANGASVLTNPALSGVCRVEVMSVAKLAPALLIGREAEIKTLCDAWDQVIDDNPRHSKILTFVGLGGEGKTSILAKWLGELAFQGWPGCDGVFAWSFYTQGTRQQTVATGDVFLAVALEFFGDRETAQSRQHPTEKARRLAEIIRQRKTLLVLDGLEVLQYPPLPPMDGRFKDEGVATLLESLANYNQGLCVLTSRYSVTDLRGHWERSVRETQLQPLSQRAGQTLLKALGVNGSDEELTELVGDMRGHALTLNLIGSYLRDACGGDVRKRGLVRLDDADAEQQGGHAFRVVDAYIRWFESACASAEEASISRRALSMLKLTGLFDRPIDSTTLIELLRAPAIPGLTKPLVSASESQRSLAMSRLERANLVTVTRDESGSMITLDVHPLVREFVAKKLSREQPDAWKIAHRRLYKYLCATAREGETPTLEALSPLYEAVFHGCEAGLHEEARSKVFHGRIQKGGLFYSTGKLGAFGADLAALACFFDEPWERVHPEVRQHSGWLKAVAGDCLRGLGRLVEAVKPTRASMEASAEESDWQNAARAASNLSEVQLALGRLDEAEASAISAVKYADRSEFFGWKIGFRTTLADVLHQAGRRSEALPHFVEAEALQGNLFRKYRLLHSLWGFRYNEFILAPIERQAWYKCIFGVAPLDYSGPETMKLCNAASDRASLSLELSLKQDTDSLSEALDRLTLCRIALYKSILLPTEPVEHTYDLACHAVASLRKAGAQEFVADGLLTRAWACSQGSNEMRTMLQSDLIEASTIAARGPMPLRKVDILLHRARLLHKNEGHGYRELDAGGLAADTDCREAGTLIKRHGYGRRIAEFDDLVTRFASA